jgi:hypothetical protein
MPLRNESSTEGSNHYLASKFELEQCNLVISRTTPTVQTAAASFGSRCRTFFTCIFGSRPFSFLFLLRRVEEMHFICHAQKLRAQGGYVASAQAGGV